MPLQVVISDASVLMDLVVGGFLEYAPMLDYKFLIPDVIYQNELLDLGEHQIDELEAMGYAVEELSNVQWAFDLSAQHHTKVSVIDCFALAMAVEHSGILLTGDRR